MPSGLADTVLPLEPISSVLRVLSSSSGTKLLDEAVSMSRLENVESLLMLLDLDVALTLDDCEEPKLEVAVIMMGTQFVSLCWNCRWDREDEIISPPNTRVQSDTGLSVGNVNDEFGNQEWIERRSQGPRSAPSTVLLKMFNDSQTPRSPYQVETPRPLLSLLISRRQESFAKTPPTFDLFNPPLQP